jgi:hypothetical protein
MPRARKSLAERIAALKAEEKQTQARLAALLAKQKTDERKRDTRRKIVVGGAVLAHAALHPAFADALRDVLRAAVTRDMDRALLADLIGEVPPTATTAPTAAA